MATLNGSVNPNGFDTLAWFQWGNAANHYVFQTAPQSVGNGTASLVFSNALSGVTPGMIYHARVVASNTVGVVYGRDVVFGTPAITLIGRAMMTNAYRVAFTDPGASASGGLVAIAGGGYHSLALRSDGKVAGWGQNTYGQTSYLAGFSNVVAIAAGLEDSVALLGDGTVRWSNGNVSGLSNVVAIADEAYHCMALRGDGTVAAWGDYSPGVPAGLSNVVAIAAGGKHSLALRSDGTVTAWGDNSSGQTNVPAGLSNVVAIAGGGYHSLALRSDGTVAAWGDNSYGQTTVPAGLRNVVAIAAGFQHSMALRSDGTVAAWGDNSYGQTTVPAGLSDVVAIAAGWLHSLALWSDGIVRAWGDDRDAFGYYAGQVDAPANLNTLAVSTNGSVNPNVPGTYTITYTAINSLGVTSTATRTVVVGPGAFVDTSIPGSPRFTFAFAATTGRSYEVLYSDDTMATWQTADTLTANTNWILWSQMLSPVRCRLFKVAIQP